MTKGIINIKNPTIVDSYYDDEDFQNELDKVSDDILINAETTRTIKNIRKCLASALKKKYGFTNGELKDLTTKILKIHGLDASNFDTLSNFARILEERVNDFSIDDNSNKNEKTVAGINNEITASNRKLIGYHMLYGVLKDLYGQAEAKILCGDLYDMSLGLSDSTQILTYYCWALDASKIVLEGRKFGQLPSAPVHRLDSYISALDETIHQMSNHQAGALAVGSFFLDSAHILMFRQRVPFSKVLSDIQTRKYIENCFQTFVHSVNHLSRSGCESPFTNISLFDRVKLKALIGKDNYAWYFPNKKDIAIDNGLEDKMTSEQWEEYVINYILALQEIYAEFHEKGDPLNNGIPFRFPVVTLNLSKDKENKILDEKFLDYVCHRDISRFNIFTSEGTKVASCCFEGNEEIIVEKNGVEEHITIKEFVSKFLTSIGELKIDTGYSIKSFNDKDEVELSKIVGVMAKPNDTVKLYKVLVDDKAISLTPNHIVRVNNIEKNEIQEKQIFELLDTYTLYNILTLDGTYRPFKIFEQETDSSKIVYDIELDKNHYFSANGIVSHNCRLINDVELLDNAASVNSFGGSGQISMGSHRVCTINFARVAYEAKSIDDFYKLLDKRIRNTAKILKAHKVLLGKMEQKGLLPFITRGWVRMDRLFSTFGILGIVEANKILKTKFINEVAEDDMIEKSLIFLEEKSKLYSKELGIISNIEQIPGESFAVRLATVDNLIYPDENIIDTPLYANQFIPLWEDSEDGKNIWRKMEEDGKYNSKISGGSIVHIQVGSKTTTAQNKKILSYAIEKNCQHFAICNVFSKCLECGEVFNQKVSSCSKCNCEKMEYYQRVVGFITPVSSWTPVRREWEFPRRQFADDSLTN